MSSSTSTTVGRLMAKKLETINASNTAQEAAKKMRDKRLSSLVVTIPFVMEGENKVLGIITSSNFIGYLEEKLNLDDVNARISQSLKEEEDKEK